MFLFLASAMLKIPKCNPQNGKFNIKQIKEYNNKKEVGNRSGERPEGSLFNSYYTFPWIAPLYPWYVPYIAEC